MSALHHYVIRAGSREVLLDKLEAARAGKDRPFVTVDEIGERHVDPSCIRYPYEEMREAVIDEVTGEIVTPSASTGDWLCEVWLTEADAELAAIAETD